MASFTFTSPEGQSYTVNGPDGATPDQAFGILQQQIGAAPKANAIGGVGDETARAFNENLNAIKSAGPQSQDPRNYNSLQSTLNVGKAIAAIPGMIASPITGAARSLIGRAFDAASPLTPDQQQQYGVESGRDVADKAMIAVAPRVASPIGLRPPPVLSPGQEVSQAASRLGVDLPRAVTSDTMGVQQMGKVATNIPIGGTPLRKASATAIGQLDDAALKAQQGYGSGSPSAAGRAADDGITDWIKNKSADNVSAQYVKVDALVDPTVKSPLTNTIQKAQDILARRDRAGIAQPSDAVNRIMEATTRGGMDYEGVKDLRSYIGGLVDTGVLPVDMSRAELKQIYGSLTDDLRNTIRNAGGDQAVNAWERANQYAQATASRRENLARIVGAKSDEQVFSRIASAAQSGSKGDIQLLNQARRSVDNGTWDEVASSVISSLGRAPDGSFTPDRFVTAWGQMSPQAKSLLFRSTGKSDLANSLDDIAKVSSRFKSLQQFANPSGTAQNVIGGAMGSGLMMDPVSAATSIMSARIVSAVLAQPAAASSLARWSKSYEMMVRAPARGAAALQAFNGASRALAEEVGRLANAPQHVNNLMRQLQGAVPARSDEQQQ